MKQYFITKFKAPLASAEETERTIISLQDFLDEVKNGPNYSSQIGKVRAESDKDKRSKLKRTKCDYFKVSGIFENRNDNSLNQHNGLILLDFDELDNLAAIKTQLSQDEYIMFMFISTSGNGLKVGIKIPADKHEESYLALESYFLTYYSLKADKACKNVGRACFNSYDEKLYFNEHSKEFHPDYIEEIDTDTGEIIQKPRTFEVSTFIPEDEVAYMDSLVKQIEEKSIDVTSDYNDYLLTAFSCASMGELGRPFFHRLSKFHPDYNEKDSDKKFNNAIQSTKFTSPGWFYRKCKDLGLNMKKKGTVVKSQHQNPDSTALGGQVSYSINWPVMVKINKEDRAKAEKLISEYLFFIHGHKFFQGKLKQGEISFQQKTNFEIIPHYLVRDMDGRTARIIEFIDADGKVTLEHIPTDSFTSKQAFSKQIEKDNRVSSLTEEEWTRWKQYLYKNCPIAEEVSILGQQEENYFCFNNGILSDEKFYPSNRFGMVEFKGTNLFFPGSSDMYRHSKNRYQFEKEFRYVKRNISFTQWAELFYKVYGENGAVAMMFSIMSLYSDIVFKNCGHFPFLHLFGKKSSGKSTLAQSLMSLFFKTEGKSVSTNINSVTHSSFYKKLNQIRNGIVLFEEFNSDLKTEMVEQIKGVYNRNGRTTSDMSNLFSTNRTTTPPIESAIILTGQYLPVADPALFTRTIHLSFFKNGNFSQEERKQYTELKSLEGDGLTCIMADILKHRSLFEDRFMALYNEHRKNVADDFDGEAAERIASHNCMLIATYQVLKDVLKFPFSQEELCDIIDKVSKEQAEKSKDTGESFQFWDMLQYLVVHNIVQDEREFKIKSANSASLDGGVTNFKATTKLLYLRLNLIAPEYNRQMKIQGRKNLDLTTLRAYLKNHPSYLGTTNTRFTGTSPTSAMVFNYELLKGDFDFEYNPAEAQRERYGFSDSQNPYSSNSAVTTDGFNWKQEEDDEKPELPF
jgi:energy-coupling factor transporter ATP-binding protein EcfA2